MRGGGEGSLGACSDSFGKNFRIPDLRPLGFAASAPASISSSEGAGDREDKEERSEESSSAAAMLGLLEAGGSRGCVEKRKLKARRGSPSTRRGKCMH